MAGVAREPGIEYQNEIVTNFLITRVTVRWLVDESTGGSA